MQEGSPVSRRGAYGVTCATWSPCESRMRKSIYVSGMQRGGDPGLPKASPSFLLHTLAHPPFSFGAAVSEAFEGASA